jgi:hypothetical protein
VPPVGRDDRVAAQALRQRHDGRIDGAKREVGVLLDEFGDTLIVARFGRLYAERRDRADERSLGPRPIVACHEVSRFRDTQRRHDELQVR